MEAHSGALRAVLSLSPGLAAPPARPGMVAWAAGSQLRTAGQPRGEVLVCQLPGARPSGKVAAVCTAEVSGLTG